MLSFINGISGNSCAVIYDAIIATALQEYNLIQHRVRPSATDHDAQMGQVTAYLAGAYGIERRHERKHDSIKEAFRTGLPHQRFARKINSPGLERAFRLEVNYVVRVRRLKEEEREGL